MFLISEVKKLCSNVREAICNPVSCVFHQCLVNAVAIFALQELTDTSPLENRLLKIVWLDPLYLALISDVRIEATQQNEGHSSQVLWLMPVIQSLGRLDRKIPA